MTHTLRKSGIPANYRLIAVLFAVAVLIFLLFWPHQVASKQTLAQCMTGKGVVMYGSDSCENCRSQKKVFGVDFKDINYVNCEFSFEECRKKNITVYPVWSLGGKILLGTQTTSALADFAGCESSLQ